MGKVSEIIKKDGFIGLIKKIIYRNYRKSIILQLKKNNFSYKKSEKDLNYYIKKIDIDLVSKIDLDKRKKDIFLNRLKDEKIEGFALINKNKKICGYTWLMFGKIYEGNTGFAKTLNDNESYILDIFIYEEFRGKGLGKYIVEKEVEYLFDKDIEKIYYFVNNLNRPSIKIAKSLGFIECGKMTYLDINNKKKIFSVKI